MKDYIYYKLEMVREQQERINVAVDLVEAGIIDEKKLS